jgi:ABC-type cobalamin/Fe3+-siderophores transport system ATPase subunit
MDVRIQDNKLVLVGENGTGKSTFANLTYYFLTRQWVRLAAYRFAAVEAVIGDQELTVRPDDLKEHFAARQHLESLGRMSRHVPSRAAHQLIAQFMESSPHELAEPDFVERLSEEMRLPPRIARDLIEDYLRETKGKPTHVQEMERTIAALVTGQFLYLPTYRRIEQDLRSIFRGVEIETELRRFRERLSRRKGAPYVELVEFGMEDVEQTMASRMTQVKESVRNGLDSLTGTYLRDVIRGVHTAVDVQRVRGIDPATLDAVFARIDEATLPAEDKTRLKDKVATISEAPAIKDEDKVIAHFLSKLIQFHTEQQANERHVREFVTLCNRYLTGKQVVYDNTKYTTFIAEEKHVRSADGQQEEALELKMLSSGEKQIVSLFSHLYFSGASPFFVVIDEPELSLSVPWQRRFLPDILGTGMCSGMIAVTHSPFVWENDLEPYVRSLAEFTTPYSEA